MVEDQSHENDLAEQALCQVILAVFIKQFVYFLSTHVFIIKATNKQQQQQQQPQEQHLKQHLKQQPQQQQQQLQQ